MSFTRQSILFIGGLDISVDETMLYHTFVEFPLSYIKIAKDRNTGVSLGYGFIGFKNYSKAEEAMIKLNNKIVRNKKIRISWFDKDKKKNKK